MKTKRKFLFTQLSAVIVICGAMIASAWVVKWIVVTTIQEIENLRGSSAIAPVLALGAVWLALTGVTVWAWGKLLVMMGILTPEEAKGYPFSRPWEN